MAAESDQSDNHPQEVGKEEGCRRGPSRYDGLSSAGPGDLGLGWSSLSYRDAGTHFDRLDPIELSVEDEDACILVESSPKPLKRRKGSSVHQARPKPVELADSVGDSDSVPH